MAAGGYSVAADPDDPAAGRAAIAAREQLHEARRRAGRQALRATNR
jgi:uncharacterized membrane protein